MRPQPACRRAAETSTRAIGSARGRAAIRRRKTLDSSWCLAIRLAILATAVAAGTGCSFAPGMNAQGPGYDSPEDWPRKDVYIEQVPFELTRITADFLAQEKAGQSSDFAPKGNPDLKEAKENYVYRVGPQDVLAITVFDHPELTLPTTPFRDPRSRAQETQSSGKTPGFVVSADGTIFFPFAGEVKVADLTTEEIRKKLTRRLDDYIESPQIQVRVSQFRSKEVILTGQVREPNTIPITDVPLTALDAINRAQIPRRRTGARQGSNATAAANLSRVILYRDGTATRLNLRALLDRGDLSQNRLLRDGDIVYVPDNAENKIFLAGEFTEPGSYPIQAGEMTLAEAIADAKGFNLNTADPSRLYVVRGTAEKPRVYWLNAEAPHAMMLADQFQLQPRDVVFASTAEIARLGRVLAQLNPVLRLLQIGAIAAD